MQTPARKIAAPVSYFEDILLALADWDVGGTGRKYIMNGLSGVNVRSACIRAMACAIMSVVKR